MDYPSGRNLYWTESSTGSQRSVYSFVPLRTNILVGCPLPVRLHCMTLLASGMGHNTNREIILYSHLRKSFVVFVFISTRMFSYCLIASELISEIQGSSWGCASVDQNAEMHTCSSPHVLYKTEQVTCCSCTLKIILCAHTWYLT